ncbi:MAG: hypothetical protein EXQ70_05755 [Solirubrobacterales bacterium]|nr:hypothetical protein [Solirubrobacterales bacterium]
MDGRRVRWDGAGKLIAGAAGALALAGLLPGLLSPGEPPPLPADVGLAPVAAQPLQEAGAAAAPVAARVKARREPGRGERASATVRRDRSESGRPRGRGGGRHARPKEGSPWRHRGGHRGHGVPSSPQTYAPAASAPAYVAPPRSTGGGREFGFEP